MPPKGTKGNGSKTKTKENDETGSVTVRLDQLADIIADGFKVRYEHDCAIERAITKHVKPLKDVKKEDWDQLAVDSGIDKKDLGLDYAKYKRQEDARTLDDDDRDRIFDNMRIVYHALGKHQMLDMIDALDPNFMPKRLKELGEKPNYLGDTTGNA